MHLIVTRPEDDAAQLAAKLRALGHNVTVSPLLRIVARDGVAIPDLGYQLAVATSANGIRTLIANDHVKSLSMLTVGPQSLRAAREAGFTNAEARGGDVPGLVSYIAANSDPGGGPILYLSGAETSGDLQSNLQALGFTVDRVTLYDAVPATNLDAAEMVLRRGEADGVLLYSPRTARIWAALVDAAELVPAAMNLTHFCLSANVAHALPEVFVKSIANSPQEDAMLALLEQFPRTV